MIYDLAVIGGGPAGMLAAGTAVENGGTVLLLDKNKTCGRKLALTGKGRCNLTNDSPAEEHIGNIPRNGRFLYSALAAFSPVDAMRFFEKLGVPLKTERGRRVFPASDRAGDVAAALRSYVSRAGVKIRRADVKAVCQNDGVFAAEADETFFARRVVIATGGASYPATGSTGDGYNFAAAFGHRIVPPRASLVRLTAGDAFCGECAGLTLKNVRVSLLENGKNIYEDFGELLFTHDGVSGPLALTASAHMDKHADYSMDIDLKPALDAATLDARLCRDLAAYAKKEFATVAAGLVPVCLIPEICKRSGIAPKQKAGQVGKEGRSALSAALKRFSVSGLALGPIEEAVVTAGGVDVRDVDPKTMESKLVSGLYFAGEVLDVDGYTGGYNLQIAFSTGYAAGKAIKKGDI